MRLDPSRARVDPAAWLAQLTVLLKRLEEVGWISGFRVEEFDGVPGSAWAEEGRGSLTVYAFDPVTMQAAQLLGEDQFETIGPKVSGWLQVVLKMCGVAKVSFEDYYLDDAYRPDPEQFRPTQFATQFDLAL